MAFQNLTIVFKQRKDPIYYGSV